MVHTHLPFWPTAWALALALAFSPAYAANANASGNTDAANATRAAGGPDGAAAATAISAPWLMLGTGLVLLLARRRWARTCGVYG